MLKKHVNLALVSSLSLMATFIAAGIIPAFQIMAKDLHEPLQSISYLTSSQIAMHGVAPLFWKPLSNRHGRRPVWLLSALGGLAFNIGCAKSSTFGSMMTCRVLTTFFISPAVGIGSAVVTETFFAKERGFKMVLLSSSRVHFHSTNDAIGSLDSAHNARVRKIGLCHSVEQKTDVAKDLRWGPSLWDL